MRPFRFLLATLLLATLALAQQPPQAPKRKKLLAIGQTKGFQHDSTSDGLATLWKIGKETGLWDT